MKRLSSFVVALAVAACVAPGCRSAQSALPAHGGGAKSDAPRPQYSHSGYDLTPMTPAQIAAVVKTLTPEQVNVTQHAGTEYPNTGIYAHEERKGTYVSVVSGLPLFRSEDKFDSGTGWPSFTRPLDKDHVILRPDRGDGMERVEVLDARSGAHLGHVFDDGPAPTHQRYCMNSAALTFIPANAPLPAASRKAHAAVAYFAGGCFWGVEDVFEQVPGVMNAESGYMGGTMANPTYGDVSSHETGHAETVRITYDPARVSYTKLLTIFFMNHDPTTVDRQGPDVGSNYRSAIFASTAAQVDTAKAFIAAQQKSPRFAGRTIVTEIVAPGQEFYMAEDYHQDYHRKNGGSCKAKGL